MEQARFPRVSWRAETIAKRRTGHANDYLHFPLQDVQEKRHELKNGGADGIRTHDLLDAIEARSQLRHGPTGDVQAKW